MKNFVQEGKTLTFTAGATIAAGAGMLLGDQGLFGINSYDVVSGDSGEAMVNGVFDLQAAAVTADPFDLAYWDDANSVVTNVSSGNTKIGYFTEAVTSGAIVPVLLTP